MANKELNNLEEKLQTLSPDIALKSYKTLKNYWIRKDLDKSNLEMISWIDRLINRNTFLLKGGPTNRETK